MKRNRIGYSILIIIFLILLLIFGQSFLAYAVVIMSVFALLMLFLLIRDAASINTEFRASGNGQYGKELTCSLVIGSSRRLYATKQVIVELEIYNKMFGSTSKKIVTAQLKDGNNVCYIKLVPDECGEVAFRCRYIYIIDVLKLFRVKAKKFNDVSMIIYPKLMNVNIEFSDVLLGQSEKDGDMQNRKGNDPSEIYDIREYAREDDMRSIHWKLTGKMDKLMIKEASEPSHYDVVIIPDFAHYNGDVKASRDELNAAVAITAAVAEQLVTKGIKFCAMIPAEQGLSELYIATHQDYQKMLAYSMCYRILEQSGSGLEYFITEHKEQMCTRLIIVSAGRYIQNPAGLQKQLGITIINAVSDRKDIFVDEHDGLEVIDIPVDADKVEILMQYRR